MKKSISFLLLGLAFALAGTPALFAQSTGYVQTNLVANVSGLASHTDSKLSNPWGISFIPGQPFWIANNNGGTSTVYDAEGNAQSPIVITIPGAAVNPCSPGCPTGTVANNSAYFSGGSFIFDSEDGILASWTGGTSALKVVDNSAEGAVYKGLALITNGSGTFLLAANFRSGNIDVFDRNFTPATLTGSFKDPNLPEGFAPHGIHLIGSQIYVAYAMQDSAKHDPTPGAGSGVVDIFDIDGNFVKTFTSGGHLNAPWGVVQTPASWGTFSGAILVGDFGDGAINAFDSTGKFLGQVSDSSNKPIINAGLWDMVYGAGGTGDPNTLYLTAGGSSQTSGLFFTLAPASANPNANFQLSVSSQSATVSSGQSTTISVSASAVNGFVGSINLSCSSPGGLTCTLSPSTITPGSSASKSTLTLSAASTPPPTGYSSGTMAWLPLTGLGLMGVILPRRKTSRKEKYAAIAAGILVLIVALIFAVGCGGGNGSNSSGSQTQAQTVQVMVTGQSGSLSHSQAITVTIN
jgi:uncharacterized protein (TIGR03118 family)